MTSKKNNRIQELRLQHQKIVAAKKNVVTIFNELLQMVEKELPQRSQRNLTAKQMKERMERIMSL